MVIAFSPVRAFRRRCSVNEILQGSPTSTFLWCLLWYAVILVLSAGMRFGLDKIQGMQLLIGSYWNYPGAARFGSAALLPINVPIVWLECLIVSCIGMVVALRSLSPRQVARLATWLFALMLLAGILSTIYEVVYQRFLGPNLFVLPIGIEWVFRLRDFGNELAYRSFDIVLGLMSGLAVGTVLQRRRWPIAITSAVFLAIAFPALASIQRAYAMSVYHPLRVLVLGPPEAPAPRPSVLAGPTFAPGMSTAALAGTWSIRYDNAEQPEAYLTFDTHGGLTSFKVARYETDDSSEFVSDGRQHEAPIPDGDDKVSAIRYRVLSASEQTGHELLVHVRLERSYTRVIRDDFVEEVRDIAEETLSGVFSDNGTVITGTSVLVRDASCIGCTPGQEQRSFIMARIRDATADP